jgi:hypothetical protein
VSDFFWGGWSTGSTPIATVNYSGTHTAVAVGSTSVLSTGNPPGTNQRTQCPPILRSVGGNDNVRPTFNVAYSSYIPVDHIDGPSGCPGDPGVRLIYMGDANRGTYRTTESIQITPDSRQSSGFFQDTGQTRNYGAGSPANGSTLSSLDEDGIQYDCHLWNDAAKATPAFSHDESYPSATEGQSHFTGSAANPLENPAATIRGHAHGAR